MTNVFVKKVTNLEGDIKAIFDDFSTSMELVNCKLIVIKPNWVMPRIGVITSKEVFIFVVSEIRKRSNAKIIVVEGAGYEFNTEKTFEILGASDLCKELSIELVNSRKNAQRFIEIGGKIFKKVRVPAVVEEADLIINLPKLKTHALTDISFSMKNLYGLISKKDRRLGHLRGLHQSIVDLARYFNKKTFSIIDGLTAVVGQGPVFGDIIKPNIIIAGDNLFALDYVACRVCGINPNKVNHLKISDKLKLIPIEAKNYKPDINIGNFQETKTGAIYRFLYWTVYLFDSLFGRIIGKDLVMEIVTRLGTRVIIDKKKAQPFKEDLIKICPVGAIKSNLEVDFLKCRNVRCLRCWEQFPEIIKIRGLSKPRALKP